MRRPRPVSFDPKDYLKLGILNLLFGVVGLFASAQLLIEYIKTLQIEDYVANCNFSVLVSCGPNMGSWQGSLFGFSNTILGLVMFTIPLIMGVALIGSVRFPRLWWHLYSAGLLFGFSFVLWLAFQSIFSLHTLCPWCIVVWIIMIPLFWVTVTTVYSTLYRRNELLEYLYSFRWVIVAFFYITIATISQIVLDWFSEF